MLQAAERPPGTRSRIKSARHLLTDLSGLLTKIRQLRRRADLTSMHRAHDSADELRWCLKVADHLSVLGCDVDALLFEGEAVVTGGVDPRPLRKARKRG